MSSTVGAPIVNPKTGLAFLKSTSFRIGQDNQLTNQRMRSIFKTDYPPYEQYGRTEGAEPPPLSEVMHRDQSFFNERESETTKSFEYRHVPKPEIQGASGKLRLTNFKMDRDLNKFHSFETVHNSYFTPKMGDTYQRVLGSGKQKSNIPQGDREKELQPLTDYRDRYKGHDTTIHKTIRAPSMHEGGPPTIKGDERSTHFNTTHMDTFLGRYQKPVATLPAPPSYNVPTGDPMKVIERETTMNASYQNLAGQTERPPYNAEDVTRVLNQTNFKQQDGHYKWNDYRSTATDSYLPSVIAVERFKPDKHRNHSDFPEGDLDGARVSERVNLTTSRFYHGNPPRGIHNHIISGANLRTKSNVWFGEPPLGGAFYNTTNSRAFPAKSLPYSYNRSSFHKESDIPLNYYGGGERNNTTAFSDYQDPRQVRTAPNPVAIDNLKKSHILPPISNLRNFSTTHNDTFYPKNAERYSYDAGRLQKSSVPLGTLAAVAD
ncbi:testis-expressed protein 45-like [Dreissena polymorpha]|uniref:Uncharacterized protein n=1 Tax=Dreissena polymorpha TaxID=45954 RepID=A0A9D4KCR5_DREPO|nr:testis-expressed protein 45-like [Dreissena polymorpha]KAH3837428.1 hypothetical protein DPMN_110817 [Dreissena polymorpha]